MSRERGLTPPFCMSFVHSNQPAQSQLSLSALFQVAKVPPEKGRFREKVVFDIWIIDFFTSKLPAHKVATGQHQTPTYYFDRCAPPHCQIHAKIDAYLSIFQIDFDNYLQTRAAPHH